MPSGYKASPFSRLERKNDFSTFTNWKLQLKWYIAKRPGAPFFSLVNTLWGNSWQIFKAKLSMLYLCFLFFMNCVISASHFFFPVWVILTDLKFMEATNTCGNVKHHAKLFSVRNYAVGYFWYSYFLRIFFI